MRRSGAVELSQVHGPGRSEPVAGWQQRGAGTNRSGGRRRDRALGGAVGQKHVE